MLTLCIDHNLLGMCHLLVCGVGYDLHNRLLLLRNGGESHLCQSPIVQPDDLPQRVLDGAEVWQVVVGRVRALHGRGGRDDGHYGAVLGLGQADVEAGAQAGAGGPTQLSPGLRARAASSPLALLLLPSVRRSWRVTLSPLHLRLGSRQLLAGVAGLAGYHWLRCVSGQGALRSAGGDFCWFAGCGWLAHSGSVAGSRGRFAHLRSAVFVREIYAGPPAALQGLRGLHLHHFEPGLEVLGTNHHRLAAARELPGTLHGVEDGHSTADCFIKVGDRVEGVAGLMVGHETKARVRI